MIFHLTYIYELPIINKKKKYHLYIHILHHIHRLTNKLHLKKKISNVFNVRRNGLCDNFANKHNKNK